MKKIGDITATADQNGEFTNGNVAAGVPPTLLESGWFNSVQREIINVLVAAGVPQNKDKDDQLSEAIKKLAKAAAPDVSDATTDKKGIVQLDSTISDSDTKVPPSKLIKAALADKPSTASMTLELNKKVNKSDVSDQLGNDKSKVPSLDLLTTELGKKAAAGSSYSKAESDNKYQPKGNYALKSDLDAYQKKTLLVSGIKEIYNGAALNRGSTFTVNEDLRGRMLYLQNSMDRGFTPIVIPQDNMTISSVATSDSWYEVRLTNSGRTFNVMIRNGGVMVTRVFVSV